MKPVLYNIVAAIQMAYPVVAQAQDGTMMGGGMHGYGWMGGYGGGWLIALLCVAVVGLIAWVAVRGKK